MKIGIIGEGGKILVQFSQEKALRKVFSECAERKQAHQEKVSNENEQHRRRHGMKIDAFSQCTKSDKFGPSSLNFGPNKKCFQDLSLQTLRDSLGQKTISRYCPFEDKSPQNAYIQKSNDVWFDIIQMFYISRGHHEENLYFHACFTA